ncbi:ATP-binding protein [Neisseria yangbaofengii]|uniref:ATP-binding protein n=1 Tax=Neisseria yangbaofengii TaxID=2709396 RepID=UPI0013EDDB30|nr:ATP-binding protein [Neisseria yangbaofengii]
MTDPLYFPRTALAQTLIDSLQSGITHAFTLFAPRRMGKTQFLIKDIIPKAEAAGFNVFYFSFMEGSGKDFHQTLFSFAQNVQTARKAKTFISDITKLEILGVSIEREKQSQDEILPLFSQIIGAIAQNRQPTLLLLDEVQELARQKDNDGLIRSLRTGLDIHQNKVKAIFTGSSTNGLRAMFNDNKAPFFHFSHVLNFPTLEREFTDFLAGVYQQRTGRELDTAELYAAFERLNKIPLYMRAMLQDMIINPDLQIEQALAARLEQMHENADYRQQWHEMSALDRLILETIANGGGALYSNETRQALTAKLGTGEPLKTSTVQSRIRRLTQQEIITSYGGGNFTISSPMFKKWIIENIG